MVTGLEYYRGGLITTVLVPLPTADGTLLIPESSLVDQTFGDWNTTIVEAKDGRMLAFQSRQDNLTDIDARFEHWESQDEHHSRTAASPLYWEKRHQATQPLCISTRVLCRSKHKLVTFDLALTTIGGLSHGTGGEHYTTTASITVPADIKGRIPVNASVMEITSADIFEKGHLIPVRYAQTI